MIEATDTQRRRALWMLVLATLYWGVSFPIIKALASFNRILVPDAGTWFLTATTTAPRYVIGAVLLLVFGSRAAARTTASEVRQGVGLGAFAAAGTLLQTDGLQFTQASTSAFLTQFSAFLIPAWLALRHRRIPGVTVWTACVLVTVGVAILGHFDLRTLRIGRGEGETLLSSIFFTCQILWLGREEFAGNRPTAVTRTMFIVEAVIFVAWAAASAPRWGALLAPWTSGPWLSLTLTLAVVCTVGAFSLMNAWQPKVTATEAGLIYCVEPFFGSAFALFLPGLFSFWLGINYPNERATWSLVIGGLLITAANVLVQKGPPEGAPQRP